MNMKKRILAIGAIALFSVSFSLPVFSADLDINALLKLVQQGQIKDNSAFEKRMQRFQANKSQQNALLSSATSKRDMLEQQSVAKESQFAENETLLLEQQQRLTDRLGSLKELFGVLQQTTADTKGLFQGSVISSQVPGRDVFLSTLIKKAGSDSTLPSMPELEQLWFEMLREMTYSGQVVSYSADVVLPTGETVQKEVVRIGSFNVISGGNYVNYDLEAGKLVELASQPGSRYNQPAAELEASQSGKTGFWIDPSRGQLLKIMGQSATLTEKVDQGGVVGYIILVLGLIGVLIAAVRMLLLTLEAGRIKKQMQSDAPNEKNALGRVMKTYHRHENSDVETLELHLAESIGSEVPKLTKGINWIKIISVVAPLLGLLGTVTGMIDVFETMSLFGTGDPKLMAGGISQALVTTVLGLVAAIPCVFLHTMTNNRSRQLIMILEERATGILARKSEMQYMSSSVADAGKVTNGAKPKDDAAKV